MITDYVSPKDIVAVIRLAGRDDSLAARRTSATRILCPGPCIAEQGMQA